MPDQGPGLWTRRGQAVRPQTGQYSTPEQRSAHPFCELEQNVEASDFFSDVPTYVLLIPV